MNRLASLSLSEAPKSSGGLLPATQFSRSRRDRTLANHPSTTRCVHRKRKFTNGFDVAEIALKASRCVEIVNAITRCLSEDTAFERAAQFAQNEGVPPPKPRGQFLTSSGCLARLRSERWWRGALKRSIYRKTEAAEREAGFVRAQAGLYASDDAVECRVRDKARSRQLLSEAVAVNELGQVYSLEELSALNVSNPKIRRSEFMTRARGFEEYAKAREHTAQFITATLPSRFHKFLYSGQPNEKFDDNTPAAGQAWLNQYWARIRSKLARLGVELYGFRIAEPHHDGTPHWHLLLFAAREHWETIERVFREHYLSDAGDELGAGTRRVTFLRIDPEKGSATGYVAKYVAKNIDGYAVGPDLEADNPTIDATDTVTRVEAWASVWGIRQFQQIGGPPVGVWRQLRRLKSAPAGRLEVARQAADAGDWCAYFVAMGGSDVKFRNRPIRILRVWTDRPGRYGEPIGYSTWGVTTDLESVRTREHEWRITWAPSVASPWTRVNNCTAAIHEDSRSARNAEILGLLRRSGGPPDAGAKRRTIAQ